MASPVEQIKDKLGIVEVVESYLKLERAGANLKARCPFHNERTPSFFVSPARQSFYCFGCNRGGDIFTFVQEMEGLDFLGALKVLAARAGIELERVPNANRRAGERLFALVEAASRYYQAELKKAPAVGEYLASRGVTVETSERWRLGFAPPGWQGLYEHLRREFKDTEIAQAGLGLARTKGTGLYDRFRNRIVFPLFDPSGRPVAFSARIFGERREGEGKYINSPETPIYSKSRLLYGFDRAKVGIRRANRTILVEGQFDLILAHQAGWEETVAVSGTALTESHLALLQRLSSNIVMAFDGDQAGEAASQRAIELGLAAGLEVKIAVLPPGRDPAVLVVKEPDVWQELLSSARHVIDFQLETLSREHSDRRLLAHAIRDRVYPYVAKLARTIDRAYFVSEIAKRTGLEEEMVRQGVATAAGPTRERRVFVEPAASPTRRERIERQLFGIGRWLEGRGQEAPVATRLAHLEQALAPEAERLILETELTYAGLDPARLAAKIHELAVNLEREILQERLRELTLRLKEAEAASDSALVAGYLKECQGLSQRLGSLPVK